MGSLTPFPEGLPKKRNVSVLVGNGLSIAFNPGLNLRTITQAMVERIQAESDDGSDVVAAMKEIANRALPSGAKSDEDFETLVGAFGAETRTLGYLQELAGLVSPQDVDLVAAIQKVSKFAEEVRDTGLSHVLEVIYERSHGYLEDARDLHSLVEAITASFRGKVVFGNLNYDTLLLSALLYVCKPDLADMGDGRDSARVTIKSSGVKVPGLRKQESDFPSWLRVQLLHLHGSVTFWSNHKRTVFAKLDRDYLESHDQFKKMRLAGTPLRPMVVLANQRDKAAHVVEYPFSLAYEMFSSGLQKSDHWIVVGYSFRDEPVNTLLRAEFSERETKPTVLVVTYGRQLSRHEIERAFGWGREDGPSKSWLTINRDGANGVQETQDWADFVE